MGADNAAQTVANAANMIAGIDTSTKAVHVAWFTNSGRFHSFDRFASNSKSPDIRLVGIGTALVDGFRKAKLVAIEKPIYVQSGLTTISLSKMVGLTQFITSSFSDKILLVDNKSWKKWIVGSGNASKPEIKEFAEAHLGQIIKEQDHADAYCIGLWAVEESKK